MENISPILSFIDHEFLFIFNFRALNLIRENKVFVKRFLVNRKICKNKSNTNMVISFLEPKLHAFNHIFLKNGNFLTVR